MLNFEIQHYQNGFWAWTFIIEDEKILDLLPPYQNLIELQKITFPKRRYEWITTRVLAFQLAQKLGLDFKSINKDENNCPFLENSNWKISISHKNNICAVFLHPHKLIGLDIEEVHERVQKTAPRILSFYELELCNSLENMTFFWAAKEALYKLYGKKGLDFTENIKIEKQHHNFIGKIILEKVNLEIPLQQIAFESYQIALCIA